MKSTLIIALLLTLVSCGKDERLKVINNSDRVSELEARVLILEQIVETKASAQDLLDLAQELSNDALEGRVEMLEQDYQVLLEEIEQIEDILVRLDTLEAQSGSQDLSSLQSQIQALIQRLNNLRSNCLNANANNCPQ